MARPQNLSHAKAIDVVLHVGHNVCGVPTWSTMDIVHSALDCLSITGCTAKECIGVWNGEVERSTEVHIVVSSLAEARRIESLVPAMAHNLDQAAIMCELVASGAEFISAV